MRGLTVGGHHVRMGYYLIRIDCLACNDGSPVRYYRGQCLQRLWRLVDRFNRRQAFKATQSPDDKTHE